MPRGNRHYDYDKVAFKDMDLEELGCSWETARRDWKRATRKIRKWAKVYNADPYDICCALIERWREDGYVVQ